MEDNFIAIVPTRTPSPFLMSILVMLLCKCGTTKPAHVRFNFEVDTSDVTAKLSLVVFATVGTHSSCYNGTSRETWNIAVVMVSGTYQS